MLTEWLLVSITAVYVFLTYRIVKTMKETNEISMKSLEVARDMVLEIKSDRDLRFRPYIVPLDCKIEGFEEKDQFVVLKNVGTGPATDCMILLFLFAKDEIRSMMMGTASLSIAPGGDSKNYLANYDYKTKPETLISFFPEKYHGAIHEMIESGKMQNTVLDVLGFGDFGSIYFMSYKNISGESYLYKSGLVKVENVYKIGSNPILVATENPK